MVTKKTRRNTARVFVVRSRETETLQFPCFILSNCQIGEEYSFHQFSMLSKNSGGMVMESIVACAAFETY